MPERPGPARVIPDWQMDKPWTDPMALEEEVALAETALLSGANPDNNSVTALLGQFAGDYVQKLGQASA